MRLAARSCGFKLVGVFGSDVRLHHRDLLRKGVPVRKGRFPGGQGVREFANAKPLRGFGKHPGYDPAEFSHLLGDTEAFGHFARSDICYPWPIIRDQ